MERVFKNIHSYHQRRAIAFVSYGSPSSHIDITGTPIVVDPVARVSLRLIAHNDNLPAVGLLFSRAEFDELVLKQYPLYQLDSSFLDMVFKISEGHVGAMDSILSIILGSDVCTFLLMRS